MCWTSNLDASVHVVPFLDIFFSLLMVMVPAALGIQLRRTHKRYAQKAETCGAVAGGIMVGSSIGVGLANNAASLSDTELVPWKNVVAVSMVAPLGMAFALGAVFALQWWLETRVTSLSSGAVSAAKNIDGGVSTAD